jgi:hypothetical protein
MQEGKNWILPEEINANRFWDFHWLEIWKNNLCPSMGPNRGGVAMDSAVVETEAIGDSGCRYERGPSL